MAMLATADWLARLWSFSLGRPFRVDSEELTVERPGASVQRSLGRWAANSDFATTTTVDLDLQPEDHVSELVVAQWVSLCDELAPLIRVLWVTSEPIVCNDS